MQKFVGILMALLLIASTATAAGAPKHYVDSTKLPFAAVPGVSSQRVWGVLNGAGYRIEVPDNWNGSLVLWAHGFRGNGLELTVDDHPLRPYLLANGYAWAASSYSKNGYDALAAAKDTHTLRSLFIDKFGTPSRIYLSGASMGGHVVALAAEKWPTSYSGATTLCGWLADAEQFDFYLDFAVAAQTLSGVGAFFPYGADYLTTTVPATKAALGPAFPFVLNASGQGLKGLTQLRSGGVRPVFDQGWLFWNGVVPGDFMFGTLGLLGGTPLPAENAGVTYQFDTDPTLSASETAFNGTVQRVTANATARRKFTPVTGNLRIPMLTLHTLGDLFTPFVVEQIYAERVAARGESDLLVQRATRDVGHCTFTPTELVAGFADLVQWVEGGVKPAGDDVLDPAAVADPAFGCQFTDTATPRLWDTVPALAFLAPPACLAP
jgi:pimeloyl-ACP methyl ester carboxylesterase